MVIRRRNDGGVTARVGGGWTVTEYELSELRFEARVVRRETDSDPEVGAWAGAEA
eukprot:CAMPEP_0119084994 /NCGR_PEP_ID=MMETSP1178-20130426/131871_1 /TAXON_ID=33656 /ORGANISM="unid sp, Strain CCMP2000" /LENGTH=54 /DNA_ID=CAMNT_0007067999 /DNA_START=78 /DNA_END=239 /DNA_ORIENTATION=+